MQNLKKHQENKQSTLNCYFCGKPLVGKRGIEALKQEPTTKNNLGVEDCVSRAEVLKLMKDNWHSHNGDWAMQESMDDIRALPSVTPQEPRKGYWIDNMDLGYHVSICSNCNWRGHGDTCLIYKPKYCPNCGCAMVEPQESENKE